EGRAAAYAARAPHRPERHIGRPHFHDGASSRHVPLILSSFANQKDFSLLGVAVSVQEHSIRWNARNNLLLARRALKKRRVTGIRTNSHVCRVKRDGPINPMCPPFRDVTVSAI